MSTHRCLKGKFRKPEKREMMSDNDREIVASYRHPNGQFRPADKREAMSDNDREIVRSYREQTAKRATWSNADQSDYVFQHKRDIESNHADRDVEQAARRASADQWQDRRTNYGEGFQFVQIEANTIAKSTLTSQAALKMLGITTS